MSSTVQLRRLPEIMSRRVAVAAAPPLWSHSGASRPRTRRALLRPSGYAQHSIIGRGVDIRRVPDERLRCAGSERSKLSLQFNSSAQTTVLRHAIYRAQQLALLAPAKRTLLQKQLWMIRIDSCRKVQHGELSRHFKSDRLVRRAPKFNQSLR